VKKILVVDDSPTVRKHVGQALAGSGYAVIEAADGVEGSETLANDDQIGLVILDVNLPRMGGLEMLEKVKANGAHASLPIIMLTTEGSKGMIDRAKAAGAKGWVVKPFKPELLVGAVTKLMGAAS
jgi:two-component system chemotaxis response regulator CheY